MNTFKGNKNTITYIEAAIKMIEIGAEISIAKAFDNYSDLLMLEAKHIVDFKVGFKGNGDPDNIERMSLTTDDGHILLGVYDIDKNEGDLYFIGKVGTNWITRNKKIPVITDVELQKYEAV